MERWRVNRERERGEKLEEDTQPRKKPSPQVPEYPH